MDAAEIAKMKVADLKKELKSRSLSTVGNKTELADRLAEALQNESDIGLDGDNDELIDEDDVLADESEILDENGESAAEDELLESATPTTKTAPKALTVSASSATGTSTATTAKKIVLNRATNPVVLAVPEPEKTPTAVTEQSSSQEASSNEDEPKVVKLDGISAKERLELRAKKFGGDLPPNADLKKQARAERFGIANAGETTPKGVDLEKLKQRQARFGVLESAVLKKAEVDEKKVKRAERFGGTATVAATAPSSEGSSEAKKKRAERFGLQAA